MMKVMAFIILNLGGKAIERQQSRWVGNAKS